MTDKICSRCIYDSSIPKIEFDENGICSYCKMSDDLAEMYSTGKPEGYNKFNEIIEEIKRKGKGKKYDCVVGASGGTDSSFMLHLAVKEWGLRPLAVHYDNTWNTSSATENIRKVTSKLNIDLYTHVVDNKESDDIIKSFFKAGVPEIDAATDLAFAEVHYRAASKHGIKYVLEGHTFMEEGVSPLGNTYFDGKYIKSIHKKFGSVKMETYPLMTFFNFMKWLLVYRIKKIRPYWYINFTKKNAMKILEKEYDWKYYGGHHLENRISAFNHSVYYPQKFNIDQRNNTLSALSRSGSLDRNLAIEEYRKPPYVEPELIEYFKNRLNLSDEEYTTLMNAPNKNFRDYKTYKKRFERLRPLFYLLAKANLVPMSFYIKYTSKSEM
jgi:N-acetyl sugar amidotransferase